jgi:hypothetical protein
MFYVVCRKEKIMKKTSTAILVVTIAGACMVHADPKLKNRVAKLEKEVAELKEALAPVLEKAQVEQIVAQQRSDAKIRMRQDSEIYSRDELREIESLYQVANKQWKSQEGKDSLTELITKYDKANRTGCALLYLGQMSRGEDRERYLNQAIADFSDCFYGDGVQVGAYARYYLAHHYRTSGDVGKSSELFEEVGELYPNAIDHKGQLLSAMIEN